MNIKKILVPVDFSRHSQQALDYALEFAAPLQAEVLVLHVVEPVAYATPADLYAGMATQLGSLLAEQRRSARRQLDQVVEASSKRGVRMSAHLRDGVAYREVVEAAKKLGAGMIIQATHGRTGLAHVLMGSVAERVVRTAECPVLTIRTSGKPAPKKKVVKKTAAKKVAAGKAPAKRAAKKKTTTRP